LKFYTILLAAIALLFAVPGHMTNSTFLKAVGHMAILALGMLWLYHIKLYQWTQDFQHSFFPKMEDKYKRFLAKILTGRNAWFALGGIIGMLIFSFVLLGIFPRKVLFFPDNIPNQTIAYIEYPQGTSIEKNQQSDFVCRETDHRHHEEIRRSGYKRKIISRKVSFRKSVLAQEIRMSMQVIPQKLRLKEK